MSASDNLLDNEKQSKNGKLQQMFQKNEVNNKSYKETFALDDQYNANMSKIAKSFRSFHDDKNLEVKTNSLVSCAKGLIECNSMDLTKSLYEYLDELKSLYNIGKQENKVEVGPIAKTEVQTPLLSEMEENSEAILESEFDIDHILKTSEQELSSFNDQKVLLKSLIDDINVNSKTKYDDSLFERNINDMINETKQESVVSKQMDLKEEPKTTKMKRKSKLSFFLMLIMAVSISMAAYMYQDRIIELSEQVTEIIKQVTNNINS